MLLGPIWNYHFGFSLGERGILFHLLVKTHTINLLLQNLHVVSLKNMHTYEAVIQGRGSPVIQGRGSLDYQH